MSLTWVLVFVGSSGARTAADADLEAWARSRWIRLEDAAEGGAGKVLPYEPIHADRIEQILEQARAALNAFDDATAFERVHTADRELRAHPELPQAAWLLAERLELEASLHERRAAGGERAKSLRRAARALEGERARPFAPEGSPVSASEPDGARVRFALSGIEPSDRVYWDGLPSGTTLSTAPGEHHAHVLRRGRAVWAGFVDVGARGGGLSLTVPASAPCTLDELSGVALDGSRVVVPSGVRCQRWAVARPRLYGGIEIATCENSDCGTLLPWAKSDGGDYGGPPQPARKPEWPAWANWVLVGAGVVTIASLVLWQAGTFDDPEPGRNRVVFYGPSAIEF